VRSPACKFVVLGFSHAHCAENMAPQESRLSCPIDAQTNEPDFHGWPWPRFEMACGGLCERSIRSKWRRRLVRPYARPGILGWQHEKVEVTTCCFLARELRVSTNGLFKEREKAGTKHQAGLGVSRQRVRISKPLTSSCICD